MRHSDRPLGSEATAPRFHESDTSPVGNDGDRLLERYRYLVRTAPAETVEQAHVQAFARLTPEQRRHILLQIERMAPSEAAALGRQTAGDPASLAQLAAHAEQRQPGVVERALSNASPGVGNLLSVFAAGFVGSTAAQGFLSALAGNQSEAASSDRDTSEEADFSEEFGQGEDNEGFAGGAGFEGDDFEPIV
jgi:hypothetical protein